MLPEIFIEKLLGAPIDERLPASLACATGSHPRLKSSESTMSPRRFRQSAWPRRWRNETMDGSTNWLQYWRPIAEIDPLGGHLLYPDVLRGTRGWPIVLAFLGLLIGLLVCIGLNLKVLESLLNYFFGLSAFAALIIFRNCADCSPGWVTSLFLVHCVSNGKISRS